MCRRIIAGYDGSERAQDALALGKLLADASGAGLVIAGVFHPVVVHPRGAKAAASPEQPTKAGSSG